MEQYIPKSALVAEIEKCYNECLKRAKITDSDYWNSKADAYRNVLEILNDTLEVKEVDLDEAKKESLAQKYIDYTFKRHNIDYNSKEGQLIYYAYMHGMNQCLDKLKAQKGE